VETGRVALIRYVLGGASFVGSGLLIDERRVLTADHVAAGSGHRVECDSGTREVTAVLRSGSPEVDLAVLTLSSPAGGFGRLGCARVDRSRVDRVAGCVAVGFPRWKKAGDQRRSAQVDGWVPTAEGLEATADSGLRTGLLTLVGDRIPGAPDIPVGTINETPHSPWGGMSGAVVVTGQLAVGVVRSHNLAAGGQSLTVTPLTAIDQLPTAVRQQFWAELGVADPGLLPALPQVTWPERVVELRGLGHRLDFTGRGDELAEMQALLTGQEAAPVVLHGLGGVGKSQLAVEYAHTHRDDLPVQWTVRGDDPSVLASDLAALGVQTGAADAAEPDIDVQLAAVRGWLASHPGWLLVIDNVDDPATLPTVHRLLPDTGPGRVIITSRVSAWPGRYHRLEITALGTDPAAELLLKNIADTDEPAARELAGELGGLPLALQQAASYCQQNGKTLNSYLALFRDTRKQARLLAAPGYDGDEAVATTWAVSIGQVHASNPAAEMLLSVLAYLSADAIPRTLLVTANPEDQADSGQGGTASWPTAFSRPDPDDGAADPLAVLRDLDDLGVDEALGMLHRYSLIQLTPEAITVHRLVQAVVRANHNKETHDACAVGAASLVWEALPGLDHDAWPIYEALLPHALAAGAHAAKTASSQDLGVSLLSLAGGYQRDRGLFAAARHTHQMALAITEQAFPGDHQRVMDALDILVTTLLGAGDSSAARLYAARSFQIAEAEFGSDHPQTLAPANNLGETLRQLGKPAEAQPYMEQAVRIAEAEFGPDHSQALLPANNLGSVLLQLGKPAEAQPYMEQALRIAEAEFGPDHPQTLLPANNLGSVLLQLGKPAEAQPYLEQALRIAEAEFGPDHPLTLGPANNLGETLRQLGKPAEAQPYLEQALRIAEAEFGPDHPQTLGPANNLGGVLFQLGKPAEAQPYLEQALRIAEAEFGPDHPQTLLPANNLGSVLFQLGKPAEAQPYLEQALRIAEAEFGPDHPQALLPANNLGNVLLQLGKPAEAQPYLEQAVRIAEAEFGPTTPRPCCQPTTSGTCYFSWASPPRRSPTWSRRCGSPRPSSAPTTPRPCPRPATSARRCGSWASPPRPSPISSRRCGSPRPSSAPTTPRPCPRPATSARRCGSWASPPRPSPTHNRHCGSPK
jgi:Tfp pilus assembly protein PilF